jgi:hypothetical protein
VTARCQGSDQIDLEGINFNNGSIATCATLNFQGIYVLANFKLADDGNGGTILYDPRTASAPGRHGSSRVDRCKQ